MIQDTLVNHKNSLVREINVLSSRIEEHDTGHIHTAISVLKHRVEELDGQIEKELPKV
jgi:hypothetical protein